MSLLISALQIYMPDFVKKKALTELGKSTAAAFEAEVPPLAGLDYKDCLSQYARFAQAQAGQRRTTKQQPVIHGEIALLLRRLALIFPLAQIVTKLHVHIE